MTKRLLDNFYTEINSTSAIAENSFETAVELNPAHKIYEGHFPEIPVAPGVTLIQLIQEVVEKTTHSNLFLSEGNNIKFLAMVNPKIENVLKVSGTYTMNEKRVDVTATVSGKEITYVKFKGVFQIN